MAIRSFADRDTERFFVHGLVDRKVPWAPVARIAVRKLDMLHYAASLKDLQAPPGNRLEALRGELLGCYSIRINQRWRVVFRWTDSGPAAVRIIDYHY